MPTDPEQTADQIADLQAQMDAARSECIRPIIMEHLHRAMRAKSQTDKYHEYHALCVACLNYIDDEDLKEEIKEDLQRPETNLSTDFIRNYKAEMMSGVPNYLILENEYAKLIPKIVAVWLKVQKALVEQGLIPWALQYPESMLEGAIMDELLSLINARKFREAASLKESERTMARVPEPMPLTPIEDEDAEEEEPPVRPAPSERIVEPEPDRFTPAEPEPEVPIEEYSDEEIEKGAELLKKLLADKLRVAKEQAERLRHARERGNTRED